MSIFSSTYESHINPAIIYEHGLGGVCDRIISSTQAMPTHHTFYFVQGTLPELLLQSLQCFIEKHDFFRWQGRGHDAGGGGGGGGVA